MTQKNFYDIIISESEGGRKVPDSPTTYHGVEQLVARQPHKLEVTGSSPVSVTKDEMTETLRSDTRLPLAGLGKRAASSA